MTHSGTTYSADYVLISQGGQIGLDLVIKILIDRSEVIMIVVDLSG